LKKLKSCDEGYMVKTMSWPSSFGAEIDV